MKAKAQKYKAVISYDQSENWDIPDGLFLANDGKFYLPTCPGSSVMEPQTLSNVLRWYTEAERLSRCCGGSVTGDLVPVANALIEELAKLQCAKGRRP